MAYALQITQIIERDGAPARIKTTVVTPEVRTIVQAAAAYFKIDIARLYSEDQGFEIESVGRIDEGREAAILADYPSAASIASDVNDLIDEIAAAEEAGARVRLFAELV